MWDDVVPKNINGLLFAIRAGIYCLCRDNNGLGATEFLLPLDEMAKDVYVSGYRDENMVFRSKTKKELMLLEDNYYLPEGEELVDDESSGWDFIFQVDDYILEDLPSWFLRDLKRILDASPVTETDVSYYEYPDPVDIEEEKMLRRMEEFQKGKE